MSLWHAWFVNWIFLFFGLSAEQTKYFQDETLDFGKSYWKIFIILWNSTGQTIDQDNVNNYEHFRGYKKYNIN